MTHGNGSDLCRARKGTLHSFWWWLLCTQTAQSIIEQLGVTTSYTALFIELNIELAKNCKKWHLLTGALDRFHSDAAAINKLSRCVARRLHAKRHQGATYPKPCRPNLRFPSRGWMFTSFSVSYPLDPTCPIWVLYLIPMAWKRHMWSTDLALVTFLRLADLISFDFMSCSPCMPNLGSLSHSHGSEEAPVVHRPGLSHLSEVGWPYHFWFHVL